MAIPLSLNQHHQSPSFPNQKVQTVAKHSSVVGGSTAALRRLCNRSIQLSQGLPEEAWNAYAATGPALHALVEQAIDQALTDEDILVEHAGADREGVRITRGILLDQALQALG